MITILRNITVLFCALLALNGFGIPAHAASMPSAADLTKSATQALESAEQQAQDLLDNLMGSGTSDQIEGQVTETAAKVKTDFNQASNEVAGMAEQAQGRIQRTLGDVKKAADQAVN